MMGGDRSDEKGDNQPGDDRRLAHCMYNFSSLVLVSPSQPLTEWMMAEWNLTWSWSILWIIFQGTTTEMSPRLCQSPCPEPHSFPAATRGGVWVDGQTNPLKSWGLSWDVCIEWFLNARLRRPMLEKSIEKLLHPHQKSLLCQEDDSQLDNHIYQYTTIYHYVY